MPLSLFCSTPSKNTSRFYRENCILAKHITPGSALLITKTTPCLSLDFEHNREPMFLAQP